MSAMSSSDDNEQDDCFFDALPGDVDLHHAVEAAPPPPMDMPGSYTSGVGAFAGTPSQPTPSPAPDPDQPALCSPGKGPSRGRPLEGQSGQPAPRQQARTLHESVPQVPRIPTRFLESGRPASITVLSASDRSPRTSPSPPLLRRSASVKESSCRALVAFSDDTHAHSTRSTRRDRSLEAPLPSFRKSINGLIGNIATKITTITTRPTAEAASISAAHQLTEPLADGVRPSRLLARRKSLPSQAHQPTLDLLEAPRSPDLAPVSIMSRQSRTHGNDLFLEMAQDQSLDELRPRSRSGNVTSRLSYAAKRRSMPTDPALAATASHRPRTSTGNAYARSVSRFDTIPDDTQANVDRYRTPPSAQLRSQDTTTSSEHGLTGRASRFPELTNRTMLPPSRLVQRLQSPDHTGRRPSLGSTPPQPLSLKQAVLSSKERDLQDESPAESSDPKQSLPDSNSDDSQTADTVWDELDDLKSRIKKLELTGKLPPTSNAAVSNGSMERPRTATTAPTTISSSPRQVRKAESATLPSPRSEDAACIPVTSNVHPLLHAALAKAKTLLGTPLYRSLEATANDALGLAAMAGMAGPQGTAFSAASIISGVTVSDRLVRRKADMMCRNLTDLCIALCEGKNEPGSAQASPISLATPAPRASPMIRYSRSTIGDDNAGTRPMSRLEARRSSILGLNANSSFGASSYADEISGSEQETPPSQSQELRRMSRASSRLRPARLRQDEVSGDEDPTIRPVSRAMTDASNMHINNVRLRDGPSGGAAPQRSPSLRETLFSRRANRTGPSAPEDTRRLSRVASMPTESGRRRFLNEHAPVAPVMEEEAGEDYQLPTITQPKRRLNTFGSGQYGAAAERRVGTDLGAGRASSLTQRRFLGVE